VSCGGCSWVSSGVCKPLARGKLTRCQRGGQRIPSVAADLPVEVISNSNTKAEIARKLEQYFAAETRLTWVVDPKARTVRFHTAPRETVVLAIGDVLDGGDVLPGLGIPVRDIFELEA
jgi:Uma2 family endonuclease